MKYMWTCEQNSVKMPTGNEDFLVRTDYNIKMMENIQKFSPKKVKRFRSAFTTDQVNYLEEQFKTFPYIGNAQRKEVATVLNIPERAVKIWFQNRRMKEKKETTVKEVDDEQSNQNPLEFGKYQLHNGSTPSANEQKPYPLPLLPDVNAVNCDRMMMTNNVPSVLTTGLHVPDLGFKPFDSGVTVHETYTSPIRVKPPQAILSNNYVKSAEFSIDLCKKYRRESRSSPSYISPLTIKEEDTKKTLEQKPNKTVAEQMIPEDLSATRKINDPIQAQLPNIPPSNPGYISVIPTVSPFYAQPYYNTNGVLWKPVNVIPTTTATVSATGTSLVPVTNTAGVMNSEVQQKKCCSCDCHAKPPLPYNVQSPSPQYIITAVQLPSPSVPKF